MRSAPLKDGVNAAPQRALLKALGLCDDEIGRPLIGVVSSKNDIVPGHMNLDKIVDAVQPSVTSRLRQPLAVQLHFLRRVI